MFKEGILVGALLLGTSCKGEKKVTTFIQPEQLTAVFTANLRPSAIKLLQRKPDKDWDCNYGTQDKKYTGTVITEFQAGNHGSYDAKILANTIFQTLKSTDLLPGFTFPEGEACAARIEILKKREDVLLVKLTSDDTETAPSYAFAVLKK